MTTEKIKDILLKDEMKSSYIDYAMSVVVGRAIPDVRDGLKPVHRRIIWSMTDNNQFYNRSHVKSARIVGECFVEGTLVNTLHGLKPIEKIKVGEQVYTDHSLSEVLKLYEMPKKDLKKIELENGLETICTKDQMFKVFTPSLKFIWKKAKDLKNEDYVLCRAHKNKNAKLTELNGITFDKDLAYFFGFFQADGWIDRNKRGFHRISFASEKVEILQHIKDIIRTKFNQEENITKKKTGLYYLRINNHKLNSKLIDVFQIVDKYAHNIKVPSYIFTSPENVIYSYLSGFIDGDGHIHSKRNSISLHSISEQFIKELQILLFSLGINSTIHYSISKPHKLRGRMIKSDNPLYLLEITTENFLKVSSKLELFHPKKSNKLKPRNRRIIASKYEEIPFIGSQIFEEFSEKQLGGRWYEDINGNKIRIGIKYPDGTKIRYAKDLKDNIKIYKSTIELLNIKEKMEAIGSEYLTLINNILENDWFFIKVKKVKDFPAEKTYDLQVKDDHQFIANGMVVHNCLGKYHPHGDSAVYNSLVRMAQDFSMRYPLIDPQGNFGSVDGDPPAAMRYCVTGDTLLLTKRGLMPIKELSNYIKEDISTISRKTVCIQNNGQTYECDINESPLSMQSDGYEGDIDIEVLSYEGTTNEATTFFDSGVHKIIQVKTKQGYIIKGSVNHPVLCWSTDYNGKPIKVWKTLGTLLENDIIIISRKGLFPKQNYSTEHHIPEVNENRCEIDFPTEITKDLAFTLGALVAEGSVSDTEQQRLSFNNKNNKYYEKVKNGLLNSFPGISVYERDEYNGWKEFSLHYRDALDFLYSIGLTPVKSDEKEIPFSILRSSKSVVASFLRGLFEGNGSIQIVTDSKHGSKSSNLTYVSKSVKLLNQLKILLLNFGILTSHLILDPRNDTYRITILGMDSKLAFINQIGFFSDRKNKKFEEIREHDNTRFSKTDFVPHIGEYFKKKYNYRFNEFFQKQNINRYNSLRNKIDYIRTKVEEKDVLLLEEIIKDNYIFQQIKSIKVLPDERVYSIRVDSECHSFVANGFINHNTEARLSQIANELVEDIDRDTVDFEPNFDNSLEEPVYLPSKLPNVLINGTKGIAVGMSTSMAPHNLMEVCQGIILTIDNPDISIEELMEIIKGPDFPTGGIITDTTGIYNAYSTGHGRIPIKGKVELEEKGKKRRLVITEIPYLLNKTTLIEQIARLIKNGVIKDVSDLRDESDRKGMRIVLDLRRNAQPAILKNVLFKRTRLFTSFNITNLVLINNGKQPKILNLKEILQEYINHRLDVIYRRNEYELRKAKKRLHKVEGLIIALNNIDDVVNIIKTASDRADAENKLMQKYALTEIQVKAILSMPLSRLTNLEKQKLFDEEKTLKEQIQEYEDILGSEQRRLDIIKQELTDISKEYGDERKTRIIEQQAVRNIKKKDLIKKEPTLVIFTKNHYIKRISIKEYRTQNRGGRGKKGMEVGEEDIIHDLFVCSTHDTILFFTSKGRVYSIRCFEIPQQSRTAKGKPIVNIIKLRSGEEISEMIPINNFKTPDKLIMVTKNGIAKKINLRLFSKVQSTGIRAQRIKKDDKLVSVKKLSNEIQEIFIATKKGYAIRFDESELRELGRNTMGVIGADLRKGDEVVDSLLVTDDDIVLTITTNGNGQRTYIKEYRKTGRAAKGVKNITLSDDDDEVIAVRIAKEKDLIIGTEQGQVIRVPVDSIRITHRRAKGVRVINLYEDDSVSAIGKCAKQL
ncbi:MAG: hypothetical protein GF317_11465 [Candidatus Lokiarchaeota archaeon]|nr:hypothetical protein [Candidatus Lokiarchaeota archaeon]MBD3200269.1 hypothetical protein [Candidatus Lokiarchaeota archaeon]